jgi:hypothetical protein
MLLIHATWEHNSSSACSLPRRHDLLDNSTRLLDLPDSSKSSTVCPIEEGNFIFLAASDILFMFYSSLKTFSVVNC